MENIEYLPLGSIVILEGGIKKVMIVAVGMGGQLEQQIHYFEYGGSLYPEGLMGDAVLFFNHENIQEVIWRGYTDQEDETIKENLQKWISESGYTKGDPSKWNEGKGYKDE